MTKAIKRIPPKKSTRDTQVKLATNSLPNQNLKKPSFRGLLQFLKRPRRQIFSSLLSHKKTLFLVTFLIFSSLAVYFLWDLPNPTNLTRHPAPASTKLLDRQGQLIYEIFADQRRTPINIKDLPDYVVKAHLAAEDKDFYSHSGFSVSGMSRAVLNIFFKQKLQGGSTITQQLVKSALLTPDRTIRRKVRELILSLAVEARYTKDQILEFYLNQIPYGGTAYGLESAAQTYFGKTATKLTLGEASLLAGLTQAPSYYSPFGAHPETAKQRQAYVLNQMLVDGFISREQYDQASKEELNYVRQETLKSPHFALWVKDLLIEKYGLQTVEEGGLTVTTTLNLDLQNFAQDTVASEVAKLKKENIKNGAALVTLPKFGQIIAMVGSKDYFNTEDDGAVNITLAYRQPGSSIKPINYAIGIDRKLIGASSLLADKPTCFLSPNQKPYCPDNYDNQFHGPTQVRFALGNSFNIPAVKALAINGLSDFVASASAFGLKSYTDPTKYGPSLALGGGEVSMLDLSTAYSVLANAGKRVDLNPIIRIQDRNGKALESLDLKPAAEDDIKKSPLELIIIDSKKYVPQPPSNIRVISSAAAFIVSHILYDNGARSATFGSSSYLNISGHPEVSVKTGTTNEKRDNWTIGYNPDVLAAVWVGNNDNTKMSNVASGVSGASPIWNKIMKTALKNSPQNWPPQPSDVTGSLVCTYSGLRAGDNPDPSTCPTRYEYFLSDAIPAVQSDSLRRDIPIFKPSQAPASSTQIAQFPDQIETQNHLVVFDTLGSMLCLDCPGGYGEADNITLNDRGRAVQIR